jgi:hypothetical protein
LGFGGWKFGMCGWLAMFLGRKSGGKILRRFLGLCERVSLSEDFACRFWMKSFFLQTSGIGSGPRVVRLLKLRASFLPFVQFPKKDKESEEETMES